MNPPEQQAELAETVRRLRAWIEKTSARVQQASSDAVIDFRNDLPVSDEMNQCFELCGQLSEARKCLAALTMTGVSR